MKRRRFGVVDVGSNSVRLVVVDKVGQALQPLFNEKVLAGLGATVRETGRLDPAGVRRALNALRRFVHVARAMNVERLDAFATEAVRAAADGAEFVAAVEAEAGLRISILSGQDEARLAACGILAAEPSADGLVGDLGGGSLELVVVEGGRAREQATLPVGPLLMQGYKRPADAVAAIDEQLHGIPWLGQMAGRTLYPVGGAWRSFAKAHMAQRDYPLRIIHHYEIAGTEALAYAGLVARAGRGQVQRLKDVSRRRRETLPHGALVLERLLHAVAASSVVFSAFGIREGLVFEREPSNGYHPLVDFARMTGRDYARLPPEGEALREWVAPLFDPAGPVLWREAVCWLSDVAGREHPDYRATHAFYRVLRMPCVGTSHAGRVYLAIALYVRYAGAVDEQRFAPYGRLLDPALREEAIRLGLALRLAFAVSPGGRDMLGATRLRVENRQVHLAVDADAVGLDGEAVERRLAELAKRFGQECLMVVD